MKIGEKVKAIIALIGVLSIYGFGTYKIAKSAKEMGRLEGELECLERTNKELEEIYEKDRKNIEEIKISNDEE